MLEIFVRILYALRFHLNTLDPERCHNNQPLKRHITQNKNYSVTGIQRTDINSIEIKKKNHSVFSLRFKDNSKSNFRDLFFVQNFCPTYFLKWIKSIHGDKIQ